MNRKHRIAGFLAMLALAVIGCGGSSSAPTMTQTQAAAAFGDVFEAMAGASGRSISPVPPLFRRFARTKQPPFRRRFCRALAFLDLLLRFLAF